jgi:hypothetical protein
MFIEELDTPEFHGAIHFKVAIKLPGCYAANGRGGAEEV